MPPVDTSPHTDRDLVRVVCLGLPAGVGGRLRTQVEDFDDMAVSLVDPTAASPDPGHNPECIVVTDDGDIDPLELAATVQADTPDVAIVLCVSDPSTYGTAAVLDAGVSDLLDLEDPDEVHRTLSEAGERSRQRRAKARDSRLLDAVFEELPIHVFAKDDRRRYVRASDTLLDFGALLGKRDDEVWPDSGEFVRGSNAEDVSVLDSGDRVRNESVYSDATESWYLTAKGPYYDGEDIEGLVGMAVDITARKEREHLFRNTSRLLRAIVQASPVPIVVYDESGVVQLWNAAAEQVFGWSAGEAIGEPIPPYVAPEKREEFEALVDRVVEEGSISGVDIQRRTADGTDLDLQLSAAIVEPSDTDRRIVSILSDVTTLKERERRLTRQTQRIEAFTSVLAHDLRNPMQVVSGQLDSLDDSAIDTDAVDRSLDRIETIVDDVLALARESPIVTDPEPITLSSVARDVWHGEDAEDSLVVDSDCAFRADPTRLRLLLSHLYENTLEHGRDGDAVTVRVGALENGFYVADDGTGIDEESRDRVLQPGYSTAPGDTGYGLNVVAEIAAAHGWELRITDNEDGGVTVEVSAVTHVQTA